MRKKIVGIINKLEVVLNNKLICLGVLTAFTVLVYCNSFTAPFTLDDFGSIVNNISIRNPLNLAEMWEFYSNRVVLYFTFSLNYLIHDTGVVGYHITNTAIHALNGFVVYLIFNEILRLRHFRYRMAGRYPNAISAAAALIFLCHPLQVNAVTYVVQRTASLAATFYFLAVYFFIRYRKCDRISRLLLTLLFTVLAMFTKENTITIPFLLLVLELMFFLKDGKTSRLRRFLIFAALFMTVPIIPGTNLLLDGYSQSDPNVTFKASTSMDRFEYFFTQMNVIALYIRLLFIPIGQNFDYSNDFPVSKTLWENNSFLYLLLHTLIFCYGLLKFKKNKLVSLGIIWFYMGLAVESSFISIKDVYFEHRLYFPIAGFALFLTGIFFEETGKIKQKYRLKHDNLSAPPVSAAFLTEGRDEALRIQRPISWKYRFRKPLIVFSGVACLYIIIYSGLTLRRNYIYSDSIRLWSDTVKKAPNSDRAHSVLASSYMDAYENNKEENKEYLELAEEEFMKALELNDRNSTAHTNLSKLYLLKKDYEKCIEQARKALRISSSEYAYHNMGMAYKEQGNLQEALDAFLEGYKINPHKTFILKSIGNTYFELEDYVNSKRYYEEFLKINRYSDSKEIRKKVEEIDELLKDGT